MKLKEDVYIRSKDKKGRQFIRKIVELPKDTRYGSIIVDKDIHNVKWVSMKNVLDAREDIIDLIKVGDYVNGCKITSIQEIEEPCYPKRLLFSETDGGENNLCIQVFNSKNIKSVATKEGFENIEYEVNKDE